MNQNDYSQKQYQKSKGFTLIELIVVFSVIAILSAGGLAALVQYRRVQVLNAAVSDVASLLQTAKSRAQSQVSTCSAVYTFAGSSVELILAARSYQINSRCGDGGGTRFPVSGYPARILPSDINFNGTTVTVYLFRSITGGISFGTSSRPIDPSLTLGGIQINGFGMCKVIMMDSVGNITISSACTPQ